MRKVQYLTCVLPLALAVFGSVAKADTVNLGYIAFDITNPPLAEVDIGDETGLNSSGDATFPVITTVMLSNLTLTVNFASGSPEVFSPSSSYFVVSSDGQSYDGQDIFNTSTNPVTSVAVSGDFSTTSLTLFDGSTVTIDPTFSEMITDSSGSLQDGDIELIASSTGGPGSPTPEPGTSELLGAGLLGLAGSAWRRSLKRLLAREAFFSCLLPLCLLGVITVSLNAADPSATIRLNASTSPGSGTAGTSQVWITGSGFPAAPSLSATTISLATTCGGTPAATTAPIADLDLIGNTYRVEFLVPATLDGGNYFVSISGSTAGGASFASTGGTDCSVIQVSHTSAVLASCNPGSSMSILAYNPTGAKTTPIVAYVPEGSWGEGTDGIQVVPLEGGGAPTAISTSNLINSCSSNSITGVSVCIDNFKDVYIVKGSSITNTLTTASDSDASFSGGSCENCTVAINEAAGTKGQAVIGMGYSGAASNNALQFLDLASLTFGAPVPLTNRISEDILWDPFRNRVLSPNEGNNYDLVNVTGSGTPGPSTATEFGKLISSGGDPDSAGLDCTTDVGLSTVEFTGNLIISDFSQATFSPGTPGSWTAPTEVVNFPEFDDLDAGTSAIAVAPGSTHLGIVNGEFGGNLFGAIQLPSKSGTGTPSFVDYVAATLPATPDGCTFAAGFDPHTTTAYTSPNNGKAYGIVADWEIGTPDYLAVIDLQALLNAPRSSGTHSVDPSFNLVSNGVVSYVKTQSGTGACGGAGASPTIKAAVKETTAKPKPVNKKMP